METLQTYWFNLPETCDEPGEEFCSGESCNKFWYKNFKVGSIWLAIELSRFPLQRLKISRDYLQETVKEKKNKKRKSERKKI